MPTYLFTVQGGTCEDRFAVPEVRADSKRVIRRHYPKVPNQFFVEKALRNIGIDAWTGRKVEFTRKGKRHAWEKIETPLYPGYIFATVPTGRYADLRGIKFLGSKPMELHRNEALELSSIRNNVDAAYKRAVAVSEYDRSAVCEYKEGQALEIRNGIFAGADAWFTALNQKAGETWPMIEATIDAFGGKVTARFEALDVRSKT